MQIIKRDGSLTSFDCTKIVIAIESAMEDTIKGIDYELSKIIGHKIEEIVSTSKDIKNVEQIQDKIEEFLMKSDRTDVAKNYILYRNERNKTRSLPKHIGLLSPKFISKYKHKKSPFTTDLGKFVYYRTYSRYLPEENRRERWWETVKRTVEYNCSLAPTSRQEAEEIFDSIFNLNQFPSGRTFWVGGTTIAKEYPMSNFNCSGTVIDDKEDLNELFYLLMLGSGVGTRQLIRDIDKFPKIRNNYELIHMDYIHDKENKVDNTSLQFTSDDMVKIIVGDSKEGWTQALIYYFKILFNNEFKNIKTIIINYDFVRGKGEKLKQFGGTASGHESLKNMFYKINYMLKQAAPDGYFKLRPIHILDINCIIGENVVSGGVRRTAISALIDSNDEESITAKSNLYVEIDGQWMLNEKIAHRGMSNNSIYYEEKPTREKLHWIMQQIRYSGEPGFVNAESALKRNPNFKVFNPCFEILLDDKQMCNLVTVNTLSNVENGKLNIEKLLKSQRLSARIGFRMTCVEFELHDWKLQQEEKIMGMSLTGWQDMVNDANLSKKEEIKVLKQLRNAAHDEVKNISEELNLPMPKLITTIKPEGTISQLPTVSSGIHYSHSPFFIRRIRISATDPLFKVCEELEYPIFNEVGQTDENCVTKVIEFPIKAPEGRTKYDVTAIEQLEEYLLFMEHYVDHNASITIHVRNDEWEEVEQWVWDNWDDIVAISFLSLDDHFHDLMPYEEITEDEYHKRVAKMKPFVPSLVSKYEFEETEFDIGNEGCEMGACSIR